MQLNPVRESWGAGDQRWLGSAHATDAAQTVTLDAAAFEAVAKNGVLPSGTPLKKGDAGKFEPVTAAGDKLAGFLFTDQSLQPGRGDVVAPMVDHGRIRVDRLPTSAFDVTTLEAPNPLFVLVKKEA